MNWRRCEHSRRRDDDACERLHVGVARRDLIGSTCRRTRIERGVSGMEFTYEALPQRVIFGPGKRAEIATEVDRLGGERVFLIADSGAHSFGDEVAAALGGRVGVRWGEAVQHVPEELAARARSLATESNADLIVSIGGGSSTGLAKAIAASHNLPIIAIPTTYAGSEQTTIYGVTGDRHKEVGKNPAVLPKAVIYDAELTVGLPASVTGPSAFNALAHSVEALYAPGHNPVTTALAMDGVRAIHRSLPTVMATPSDLAARGELLYGAYLSGMALGATAAAFHHKICHVLGGAFNLVHADAHSVILPHAIAFLAPALPDEMARLGDALGAPGSDPAVALWDLASASKVPTNLQALGLQRTDLDDAARRAFADIPQTAPRPFTEADLLGLLTRAFDGRRPGGDT
jgi:maleylacetate reductase